MDDAVQKPSKSKLQSRDAAVEFESTGNPEKQNKGSASASEYIPGGRHRWIHTLGASVAISPEYALIGSPGPSPKYSPYGARLGGGAVFLLKKAGGQWRLYATLTTGPQAEPVGYFGGSVDMDGTHFIVRQAQVTKDQKKFAGAVHTYKLHENGIEYSGRLSKHTPIQAGMFGEAVAVDGEHILIGATGEDDPSRNSGAAYLVRMP